MTCPVNSARCGCAECQERLAYGEMLALRQVQAESVEEPDGSVRPMTRAERRRAKEAAGHED